MNAAFIRHRVAPHNIRADLICPRGKFPAEILDVKASLGCEAGCHLRREVDHSGSPEQVDQPHVDGAVLDRVRDGAGRHGVADREALLTRLAKLAPWHPSAIRPGDGAAGARQMADRPDADQPELARAAPGRRESARSDSRAPSEDPEPARSEPEQPESDDAQRERREPEQQGQSHESVQDSPAAPPSPPSPDRLPPDPPESDFWGKVPWLRALWRDHVARWPERPPRPDRVRPEDLPGSWRGDGDRCLSAEDNAEADRQIGLLRRPEEAVTGLLTRIEHDNPHAGVLVGLDHRLKGPDRLKEKIADKLGIKGVAGAADAVKTINDAIRYTFCFGGDHYVRGHDDVQARLESAGCRMTYRKNHWPDDPHYKGINSRWTTPDRGRFELQFHTRESFYAKEQLTHPAYRRLRQPTTTAPERRELLAFQSKVSAAVPEPAEVRRVTDFKVRTPDG